MNHSALNESMDTTILKEELENLLCRPKWEQFIIEGLATTVIFLPGVVLNIISIIVLSRPSMKSTFNFLLSILISLDTIFLSEHILMRGLRFLFERFCIGKNYLLFFVPLVDPYTFALANTARVASIYLMALASLERCVAICLPFKREILFSWERSKLLCVACIVFATCFDIPVWFENTATEKYINGTFVGYIYEDTILMSNETYVVYYCNWATFLVLRAIPFTILLTTNLTTYQKVRKMNKARRTMTQLQAHEVSVTNILFMIVSFFLISNVVTIVLHAVEAFDPPPLQILLSSSNFLSGFNSATNAMLYCFMSSRFRVELRAVLKFCTKM